LCCSLCSPLPSPPRWMLTLLATHNASGNATIRCARLFATLCVHDRNARCNARRRLAPSALFTANSPNALFVALRICVRKKIALNAKLFAPPPSATLPASRRKLTVRRCAKRRNATGRVRNRRRVRDQNVNYNAKNPNATLLTRKSINAALAPVLTSPLPSLRRTRKAHPQARNHHLWNYPTAFDPTKWMGARQCAARAHSILNCYPLVKRCLEVVSSFFVMKLSIFRVALVLRLCW